MRGCCKCGKMAPIRWQGTGWVGSLFSDELMCPDCQHSSGPWREMSPTMNEDRTIAVLRANCEPETPGDEHSEASAKLWRIMFGQYDALTTRVAELEGRLSDMADDRDELRVCVQELKAERDRLREALCGISLCSQNSMSSKDECGKIARAALEPKPKEEKA